MRSMDKAIEGIRELCDDFDQKWGRANEQLKVKQGEVKVIEKKMMEIEEIIGLLMDVEKILMERR